MGASFRRGISNAPRLNATIETLEERRHFAVNAVTVNGVMTIIGDDEVNDISVRRDVVNGVPRYVVVVDFEDFGFDDAANVNEIVIDGKGAGDTIAISSDITINATILGSGGVDWITGGGGNDTILGGDDWDVLRGGPGNDSIYGDSEGQSHNDEIYGDAGLDKLYGRAGSDSIWGGADNDEIYGDDGEDEWLEGGGRRYNRGWRRQRHASQRL